MVKHLFIYLQGEDAMLPNWFCFFGLVESQLIMCIAALRRFSLLDLGLASVGL